MKINSFELFDLVKVPGLYRRTIRNTASFADGKYIANWNDIILVLKTNPNTIFLAKNGVVCENSVYSDYWELIT